MSVLLALVPLIALLAALLRGCFPGARLLDSLRCALSHTRRRASDAPRPVLRFPTLLPRGGALLAAAMAGRGPPISRPLPADFRAVASRDGAT